MGGSLSLRAAVGNQTDHGTAHHSRRFRPLFCADTRASAMTIGEMFRTARRPDELVSRKVLPTLVDHCSCFMFIGWRGGRRLTRDFDYEIRR